MQHSFFCYKKVVQVSLNLSFSMLYRIISMCSYVFLKELLVNHKKYLNLLAHICDTHIGFP